MRYSRKKKLIVISCLAVLVLSIGIGFAAFSTTLKINGNANVSPTDSNFKVIFADSAESGGIYTQLPVIPTSNPSDLEKSDGEIATEGTKISNLGGVFTEDGQSITYDFFVYNVGKYDAYLTNIDYTYKEGTYSKRTCTNNGASENTFGEACNDIIIKVVLAGETYTGSTIFTDHVLAKGEYEPIQVIIEYPEGSDLPDGEMDVEFSDIELIFGTIDEAHPLPDAALMANTGGVFRFSDITRNQIESIETVSTIDVPYDAIDSCDASAKQDETVIAWYKDEDGNGLYELYIGGEGTIKVTSGESLFSGYTNATSIDLTYFDTSNVTSMSSMFSGDSKLESLIIDNLDGSSVETIAYMFSNVAIDEIILNDFNAPHLANVDCLFMGASIGKLEMNNFTAGEVLSTSLWKNHDYYRSPSLYVTKEISMKNLKMPKLTNASFMFENLPALTKLDISGIYIPNVTNMQNMFLNIPLITEIIGIGDLKNSNVEKMNGMFAGCKKLEKLDLSNFDTSNVVTMESMFSGCSSLKNLDLSNFDTSKVTDMSYMFSGDSSLGSLIIDNFDGSSVTSMKKMFEYTQIDELVLNDFNAPHLANVDYLFMGASIGKLEMNNFTAGEVLSTNLWKNHDYYRSPSLYVTKEISMKNLKMPKLTNASFMFENLPALTKLDISGIYIPNVTNMQNMFLNIPLITEIIGIGDLKNSNVEKMNGMFAGCKKLEKLDLSSFDFSNVNSWNSMFDSISINVSIKLKDTYINRNFMNTNFSNYTNITWV